MRLIDLQSALGRTVRAGVHASPQLDDLDLSPDERSAVSRVLASAGFRATAGIQRSWCEARSANGARLTLSALPPGERRELVAAWVDQGGGTSSFFSAEADAFLGFLARRLPNPSHALTLCCFERSVLRARIAAEGFEPVVGDLLDDAISLLRAGADAALVPFFTEPARLLAALEAQTAQPPVGDAVFWLLVAPGLPGLARPADGADLSLWRAIERPAALGAILRQGHARQTIESFLAIGAAQVG